MNHPSSPIRSMTGFARIRRGTPRGEFTVNIKSLNHRGLDIHLHLAAALEPFESKLRDLVKRRLARGCVHITLGYTPAGAAEQPALNQTLLEAYLAAFRDARDRYGLGGEPDLNVALRIPGMFAEPQNGEAGSELANDVEALLGEALDALNLFREREGAEIAAVLRERNAAIAAAAARMEEIRVRAVPAFQARLEERLGELLGAAGMDPQRLAQEAAILADRSDIGEELARLKMHSAQLEGLVMRGGEAGKKLDFLLQEMNREVNTILSKTSGIGETGLIVTEQALAAKADVEKIREQSLNLE